MARCEPSDKKAAAKDLPDEINEDVLAKLRAFEEENKKLKEQLTGSVCCPSRCQNRRLGLARMVLGAGCSRLRFIRIC